MMIGAQGKIGLSIRRAVVGMLTILGWGLVPAQAWAADPAPRALAQRAFDSSLFAADNARFEMDLAIAKDKNVVRSRKISALIRRVNGELRSYVEFAAPADVAGTRFLSLGEGGETRQFIYLPAFKKVKRIIGAERSENFMGTDFSYADLEGRKVDDANWVRLPDQKIEGEDCYVLECTSKKPDQAYGRTVLWVHKQHLIPLRSDFYDRSGKEVQKRLTVQKLSNKDGHWVALDTTMASLKKGTETRLLITALDFKKPIPDEALTREALER